MSTGYQLLYTVVTMLPSLLYLRYFWAHTILLGTLILRRWQQGIGTDLIAARFSWHVHPLGVEWSQLLLRGFQHAVWNTREWYITLSRQHDLTSVSAGTSRAWRGAQNASRGSGVGLLPFSTPSPLQRMQARSSNKQTY